MRVRFPYVYSITGYLPRRRTSDNVHLVGWETAHIPEIKGNEAPVIMECTIPKRGDQPEKDMSYRTLNSALLSPACLKLQAGRDAAQFIDNITSDNIAASLAQWWEAFKLNEQRSFEASSRFTHLLPEQNKNLASARTEGMYPFRKVEHTDKDKEASTMRAILEQKCAFIDGRFYVRSLGPGWVVQKGHEHAYDAEQRYIRCSNLTATLIPEIGVLYPYDRKKVILPQYTEQLLKNITLEAEQEGRKLNILGKVQVLGSIKNTFSQNVLMEVQSMLDAMRTDLGYMNLDSIEQFISIQRQVKHMTGAAGREESLELVEEATSLLNRWDAYLEQAGKKSAHSFRDQFNKFQAPEPELKIVAKEHEDDEVESMSNDDVKSLFGL